MSEPLNEATERRRARDLRIGDVLFEPTPERTRRVLTNVSVYKSGGGGMTLTAHGWSVIVPTTWQVDAIPAAAVRNERIVGMLRAEILAHVDAGLSYRSAQHLAERLVESLTSAGELR